MLSVRKTTIEDLNRIDEIFVVAKRYMKEYGNTKQWSGDYPNSLDVKIDIENDCSYVVVDDDKIVGTFAFIIGEEKNYLYIENGTWLNNEPYGTIHRIASVGKGVFKCALDFCESFNVDIKIDTHVDNKPMIHVINKYGFKYCGIIYVEDKTERLAFQLCRKS